MLAIGEPLYHHRLSYADCLGVGVVDYYGVPVGIELDTVGGGSDAERGKDNVGAAAAAATEPGKGSGPEEKRTQAGTALRHWRHRCPPRAARGGAGDPIALVCAGPAHDSRHTTRSG